jgi:hypothetical protein
MANANMGSFAAKCAAQDDIGKLRVKIPTLSRLFSDKLATRVGQPLSVDIRRTDMSGKIDPEAKQPTTVQSFEESDRNPPVASFGGADAEGGLVPSPGASEQRVTREGPAVSADVGLWVGVKY